MFQPESAVGAISTASPGTGTGIGTNTDTDRMASDAGDDDTSVSDIVTMLGRRLTVYTSLYQTALAERLHLGVADVKALELVIEFEPITTGQLACLAGISSGGTTAVIDRLEVAGYVVRDKHPLDRRIVVIRPVAAKCAEIERHMRSVAEEVAHIGAHYEHEQLSAVHSFLAQCVHALKTEALGMLKDNGNANLADTRREFAPRKNAEHNGV